MHYIKYISNVHYIHRICIMLCHKDIATYLMERETFEHNLQGRIQHMHYAYHLYVGLSYGLGNN
jgi:hypothetical protein